MAPAFRAFRRHKALSLLATVCIGMGLLVLLGALAGIGPRHLAELEQRLGFGIEEITSVTEDGEAVPHFVTSMDLLRQPRFEGGRIVGEFEQQKALLLGCNELIQYCPDILAQLIGAMKDRIHILALVHDDTQRNMMLELLAEHGLPQDAVECVITTARETWVRDYGPTFLKAADGAALILDPQYSKTDDFMDDFANKDLTRYFGLPRASVPLMVASGNMLHNGQGLCLTTTYILAENGRRGRARQDVAEVLTKYYKVKQWMCLPPMLGEHTNHIDMSCTFVNASTVVVGQFDPRIDAVNAQVLDEVARTLAQVKTEAGPLKVERIPMPPHSDGHFRTYTNVIFANGVLIVPQYPAVAPELDKQALMIYQRLLPGWQIVGIDSEPLIQNNGSFHCVSMNVPEHTQPGQ